jgi:hypothetical protein
MKRNKGMLRVVAVIAVIVIVSAVLVGWASERRATVSVEPLSCYELDGQVVCVDGSLSEQMSCERLDSNTVLCTGHAGNSL